MHAIRSFSHHTDEPNTSNKWHITCFGKDWADYNMLAFIRLVMSDGSFLIPDGSIEA
jgi:hypothetical protein